MTPWRPDLFSGAALTGSDTNAGEPFERAQNEWVSQDVAILRRALEAEVIRCGTGPADRPFLAVLCGLPGTGKSYFAGELVKHVPFLVLESDRLRKVLAPRPRYTPGEHSRVFAACHYLVEAYLAEGKRVLFDATNLTESYRQPLYRIADGVSASLVLVWFTAPRKTIRRRLAERASGLHRGNHSDADWLVYCRLAPHEEPIRRQHFVVDSSKDISPMLEEIIRLVRASG